MRPDIVLMDINPGGGIDGIKAAASGALIPVIYLTAYTETAVRDLPDVDLVLGSARHRGDWTGIYFVCRSPAGTITVREENQNHLEIGEQFADVALRAGMSDWLVDPTS